MRCTPNNNPRINFRLTSRPVLKAPGVYTFGASFLKIFMASKVSVEDYPHLFYLQQF